MAEIDWNVVVEKLVKSKNFKENLKKVLVENSSALNNLNNKEKFAAAKRWTDDLPIKSICSKDSLASCAEYVIDHREEDSYYTERSVILSFKENDHFNLIRNLLEHYICRVYNATHPIEYERACDDAWVQGCPSWPSKRKGKFTTRQHDSFYYIAEKLEDIRLKLIENKLKKTIIKKSIEISQFEQDLILEMIEYYLNLPEKNWYTTNYDRRNYHDTMYDLQYLHEMIENL